MAQVASLMNVELEGVEMELRAQFPLEGNYGVVEGASSAMGRLNYLLNIRSPASREEIMKVLEEAEKHCLAINSLREAS